MNSYEGKVALVSGAGAGIGEATVVALAEAGAVVYGLTSSPASRAAAEQKHPKVRWLAADLGKRAEVNAAVKAMGQPKLDLLVNNAGIYEFAPIGDSDDAMIQRHFDVNIFGPIHLVQATLPALRASKGAIVNVSSTSAQKPMPGHAIYGASKGALESLTKNLAVELATDGIRVNAVVPGPTMTRGVSRIPLSKEAMEAAHAHIKALIPLGRIGAPEEVAHWILRLGDPAVTWVTGQLVGVDGGLGI